MFRPSLLANNLVVLGLLAVMDTFTGMLWRIRLVALKREHFARHRLKLYGLLQGDPDQSAMAITASRPTPTTFAKTNIYGVKPIHFPGLAAVSLHNNGTHQLEGQLPCTSLHQGQPSTSACQLPVLYSLWRKHLLQ